MLGVPATSAPIEHAFSHSGNILRPNRCRLLPKKIDQLIYLKINAGELYVIVVPQCTVVIEK